MQHIFPGAARFHFMASNGDNRDMNFYKNGGPLGSSTMYCEARVMLEKEREDWSFTPHAVVNNANS